MQVAHPSVLVSAMFGVLSVGIALFAGGAYAQNEEPSGSVESPPIERRPGNWGLGVQVGQPGGVTLKWYRTAPIVYAAAVTTDGDDYALLLLNRLWEVRLRESPLGAYVGPGVTAGATALDDRGAAAFGLNGMAGFNFYVEPFEVFLQVTPRFRFLPNRVDDVGGSVGLRLYL